MKALKAHPSRILPKESIRVTENKFDMHDLAKLTAWGARFMGTNAIQICLLTATNTHAFRIPFAPASPTFGAFVCGKYILCGYTPIIAASRLLATLNNWHAILHGEGTRFSVAGSLYTESIPQTLFIQTVGDFENDNVISECIVEMACALSNVGGGKLVIGVDAHTHIIAGCKFPLDQIFRVQNQVIARLADASPQIYTSLFTVCPVYTPESVASGDFLESASGLIGYTVMIDIPASNPAQPAAIDGLPFFFTVAL